MIHQPTSHHPLSPAHDSPYDSPSHHPHRLHQGSLVLDGRHRLRQAPVHCRGGLAPGQPREVAHRRRRDESLGLHQTPGAVGCPDVGTSSCLGDLTVGAFPGARHDASMVAKLGLFPDDLGPPFLDEGGSPWPPAIRVGTPLGSHGYATPQQRRPLILLLIITICHPGDPKDGFPVQLVEQLHASLGLNKPKATGKTRG